MLIPLQEVDDNLIFCDLTVFSHEERDHHMQLVDKLFGKVSELRESDEGYALRLADEDGILYQIADFIKDDRRCCQFIHFGMEVEAQGRGIWLTFKGDATVKEAIRAELFDALPDHIANYK